MADDGLEDEAWWRGRQDDYLTSATTLWRPTSPLWEDTGTMDGSKVPPAVSSATSAAWTSVVDSCRAASAAGSFFF